MDWQTYIDTATAWLAVSGLRIVVIFVLTAIGLRVARFVAGRVVAPFRISGNAEVLKRAETVRSLIQYMLVVGLLALAVVLVLSEFGIAIGPIIAAAGIVGVAVGLGAQHLVRDVISGFFILLEDMIRVGDVVKIGNQSGLVEQVTMRMVVLRDEAGNVHYVRNGSIDVVTNMTKEFSRYVFEVSVAAKEDVDAVAEVMREVHAEIRADPGFAGDILEPMEIFGVEKIGQTSVVIKARTTTRPMRQWAVGREFNSRLKRAFEARGIELR